MEEGPVTHHEHIHTHKMNDTTFFYKLWKLAAITVCLSVGIIAGCETYTIRQKVELIDKGSDPIAVKCAIEGINSQNITICTLYTTRQN
jgi:hypothetical protein